jgi:HSP20 family protein
MATPEPTGAERIPVSMYRTEQRLTVAAPMPGLLPEHIRVEVTADGRLLLAGEPRGGLKSDESVAKEILVEEWQVGVYRRELALPDAVDGERATVTYGNGVVVVALPRSQRTRPASLRLEPAGAEHGRRVGSSGRAVEPLSTEAFEERKARIEAEHGGSAGPFAD